MNCNIIKIYYSSQLLWKPYIHLTQKYKITFFPRKISGLKWKIFYFKNWESHSAACNFNSSAEINQGKGINWSLYWIIWNVIRAASPAVSADHEKVKRSCKRGGWMSDNFSCNNPWEKLWGRATVFILAKLRPEFVFFCVFYSSHGSWCRKTIEMSEGDSNYCKFCLLQLSRVIWKL